VKAKIREESKQLLSSKSGLQSRSRALPARRQDYPFWDSEKSPARAMAGRFT
jgi:hypothetical protein